MFIELVDVLRCPNTHEETWLVAAVDRLDGRYIAEGSLGCPICRAEYPIREFVAYFASPGKGMPVPPDVDAEGVTRLAALLGLSTPGGFIALAAGQAAFAAPLAHEFDVQCVIVDPTALATPGDGVSVLCASHAPLSAGAMRGVVLDAGSGVSATALVHALRTGGRMVAPATAAVPNGIRELARDAQHWVGERVPDAGPLVPLTRNPAR
ncbi:MAG: hypothetical protein U0132_07505 [Gemmatimonadaceae bacterium]